jgi:hypothetical protein
MIRILIVLSIIGAFLIPKQKGYNSYNCNCLRATQFYNELPIECRSE